MRGSSRYWTFAALALAAVASAQDEGWNPLGSRQRPENRRSSGYREAVWRTADMVRDREAARLVERAGLDLVNLTWEDTGRFKGSSVGPNISDMTIQVRVDGEARSMPVMRFDNFSDKTADVDPRDFTLLVGNEKGRGLRRVSLYEYLEDPTRFMTDPRDWRGRGEKSLLADRDDRVLVSAQACFLPVPARGKATFNPVLFNYQSTQDDPAVLTILASREGTSMTVIDNKRDTFREGSAWGQRLFFNRNGMRASFTGERLSDFRGGAGGGRDDDGLSMVLLIQVPLKQRNPPRAIGGGFGGGGFGGGSGGFGAAPTKARGGSDVEAAVIGHGRDEGPFTEIGDLAIERDPRYPVRVTVQFYKATSNGVVDEDDVRAVRRQIDWVYSHGDAVGSLVTEGRTGRITEYDGAKVQPRGWWQEFWRRYERDHRNREWAERRVRQALGDDYERRPVTDLYLRELVRGGR